MPVARLDGVTVAFAGRGRVLDDLSFRIEPGARYALVGPSGTGKSTLLGVLGLTLTAHVGTVEIRGTRVSTRAVAAALRRREIGWVLQQPVLLGARTALDNVALAAAVKGVPWGVAHRDAAEWLDRVGLTDRAGTAAGRLSGGERQRVAVARALSVAPALLLADEPTAGLDPSLARTIATLIFQHAPASSAVVVATHDTAVARVATHTIMLSGGELRHAPQEAA